MRVLVFDTETTGLPTDRKASIYDTVKWPFILQLSYIIYDTEKNAIIRYVDGLIDVPDEVVITEESTRIHGITKEMSRQKGIPIIDALQDFDCWVKSSQLIVGHNISFDKRMIIVEHIRHKIKSGFGAEIKVPQYCTMRNGANICNIVVQKPNQKPYVKFPKLSELYSKLFNEEAHGVHNAFADVLICLRCYCMMTHQTDIKNVCTGIRQLFRYYCRT